MTRMHLLVGMVLAGWLALVLVLGASGAFVTPAGMPPLPIALGFGLPLLAFGTAWWLSASFRAFVLGIEPALIVGIQAWRFAGFEFLALYAHHVLPAGFALRAGLGDMAIGLTAPFVAVALTRRREFAAGSRFMIWNAFGILDLITAIASGAIGSMQSVVAGEGSTGAMAQMPLVLVPVYLVPIFFVLHLVSLAQARRMVRG